MVDEKSLEKINSLLESVNAALGGNIKIALVPYEKLKFIEKNDRYMTSETFKKLVDNIRKDGQLSQIPFCVKEGDMYEVLSGNHRVKAGHEADVELFLILYTDKRLTRSRKVAIQLSHNSLVGQDDFAILKDLYTEITDLEQKVYAGLDDKTLETLEAISLDSLSEVNLEFRSVSFVLLPEEHARLDEVFKSVLAEIKSKNLYIGRKGDYEAFMRSIGEVQDSYHIKNVASALTCILDVFESHRTDLQEGFMQNDPGDSKKEVPTSAVFGTDRIKEVYAVTITKALEKAKRTGEASEKNPWEFFYKISEKYLATA